MNWTVHRQGGGYSIRQGEVEIAYVYNRKNANLIAQVPSMALTLEALAERSDDAHQVDECIKEAKEIVGMRE